MILTDPQRRLMLALRDLTARCPGESGWFRVDGHELRPAAAIVGRGWAEQKACPRGGRMVRLTDEGLRVLNEFDAEASRSGD